MFGGVTNICNNNLLAGLTARIWVDNTQFNSKDGTYLKANMGDNGFTAFFEEKSEAALYAAFGSETARAKLEGSVNARILTKNRSNVNVTGAFYHWANADYRHYFETKCTGWGFPAIVVGYREQEFTLGANKHCDFCGDVTALVGWNGLMPVLKTGTYGSLFNSGWSLGSNNLLDAAFAKALAPINDVNRMVNGLDDIAKARYGEEEDQAAGAIYVLEIEAPLKKDVTLGEDRLARYRLWNNSLTQHDVYLLPNATRLYRSNKLEYVSEVLRGDARDTGESFVVDVFTALTPYAYQNPVIPVGTSASLNFTTGQLSLPVLADFELYLHEVSGAWLLENFRSGFFRRMDAPQADMNAYALGDGDDAVNTLPTGTIMEGITQDGDVGETRFYWVGDGYDSAADDAQTLILLLHNEQTDELTALRTSRAMIAAGEESVPVSLYIFRDSKSDRMGEEKYNVLFFDTPAGEKSLVKVITDVLEDRELDLPKTLRVVLRPIAIEGIELPAYSLTDHYFVMCDGTGGRVSLFDGFYTNTFDGQTFESDYLKIEGVMDGNLKVTVKQDQAVWPEKSDDTHAVDLNETSYELVNGVWLEPEADAEAVAA